MATEITMPQLSDTMDKGKILTWFKSEGDTVTRGDALAEVATDKADLEIEAFESGTLLKICIPVGDTASVGEVIAILGKAGEQVAAPAAAQPKAAPAASNGAAPAPAAAVQSAPVAASQAVVFADEGRVKISPLARNLALANGIDYSTLAGSGDGGRIVKRDIEGALGQVAAMPEAKRAVPGVAPVAAQAAPSYSAPQAAPIAAEPLPGRSEQELSPMRATIARRMVEAVTTIPHFYMTTSIEVSELEKVRQTLKEHPHYQGVTLNHLVVKAAGLALRKVPRINAHYREGKLVQPGEINIGVVTALEDGLLIPVVKNADSIHLSELVAEANAVVARARSGRPKADDLTGGTFSISNVGRSAVDSFTAVISPGQGAILAVSTICDEPVVKQGAIVPGRVLRLTLSVDHRIIDGVVGGQFLTVLKELLEEPILLLA